MIEIIPGKKDTLEGLLKKYKRKLKQLGLIKKKRGRIRFEKKSEIRRREIQKAIQRERYRRIHGLV